MIKLILIYYLPSEGYPILNEIQSQQLVIAFQLHKEDNKY